MREALLLSFAYLAGALGMAWFALAKLSHWRQVTGQQVQTEGARRALRIAGSAAAGVCLVLCLAADHISMAFLVWVMIQASTALGVAMILTYCPRWMSKLAFPASGAMQAAR